MLRLEAGPCPGSGGFRQDNDVASGRHLGTTLPNLTKCGGLTGAWRIAWMAYEHNVQWVPHGWNTAIGLAADLHLSAAMPVARYVEYLTPCVYLDEIITEPFRPDAEGYLIIPEKPGLGIEINREAIKQFGV